jgi:competence protein ComEA
MGGSKMTEKSGFTLKTPWALAIGLVGGLLGAALLLLINSAPRGEPVELLPPPTAAPLSVHVAGAVEQPGVYQLPRGSRVQDAIEAAGGLRTDADPQTLNLAARLEDGSQIYVPAEGEDRPASVSTAQSSAAEDTSPLYPININTASVEELQLLPGIGESKAESIVEYREANGLFASIEDIMEVSGIGQSTFDEFKELITVGGTP